MGYLGNDGNTLRYEESVQYQKKIKEDGVSQFLNLMKKFENFSLKDSLKNNMVESVYPIYWGDEVEGHIVYLNKQKKTPQLVVDLHELFDSILQEQQEDPQDVPFKIMPEYGAWMIETTPFDPYLTINNLEEVAVNLKERSKIIQKHLSSNQKMLLTSTFPLLGQLDTEYFVLKNQDENTKMINTVTQSLFIDDRIINGHPRFHTLSQNIRERRQQKVQIKVPLFIDKNTTQTISAYDPEPGFIYMDAMAFGMGSSCIQISIIPSRIIQIYALQFQPLRKEQKYFVYSKKLPNKLHQSSESGKYTQTFQEDNLIIQKQQIPASFV